MYSGRVLKVVGCFYALMGHEAMCLQACNFVETSKSFACPECSSVLAVWSVCTSGILPHGTW